MNVGLSLKSNAKNEEAAGFTKRVDDQWLYSTNALQCVSEYIQK